jgi:hypothetical protein
LDVDIQGMCESNLTSKSQLISRNLDLVLVSSDGDDVEEYGSTGHGLQGMFFCYTSYSHINLAGLRYQCCLPTMGVSSPSLSALTGSSSVTGLSSLMPQSSPSVSTTSVPDCDIFDLCE